jgi:uncharacterized protein (DUF2344 family)
MKKILLILLCLPTLTLAQSPQVTSMSPASGGQGQILTNIDIIGTDINFGNNNWPDTVSDFRFSQAGTGIFYGFPSSAYQSSNGYELNGYLSIPSTQSTGWYDLEVYDQNTSSWIMLNNAIEVLPSNNQPISITPSVAEQGDYLLIDVYGEYRSHFFNLCDYGMEYQGNSPSLKLVNAVTGDSIFFNNGADMDWNNSTSSFLSNFPIPINADTGTYHLLKQTCQGMSYDYDTIALNVFEVYNIGAFGCTDSVACNYNATATVNDGSCNYSNTGASSITGCWEIMYEGNIIHTSGSYNYIYTNAAGCDSVHTLNVTIYAGSYVNASVDACDSFTWHGTTYTSPGTHTAYWTGQNVNGCDSIVALDITINNSTSTLTIATACDSYNWSVPGSGGTFTSSGTYTNVWGPNAQNCSHTDSLILTINYSNTGATSETACDSYTWDGVAYTASGAYTNTYTNISGCDSVHTLNLTIYSPDFVGGSVTECDSFTWHGTTYTSPGFQMAYWTGQNINGCDSTVELYITINNSTSTFTSATACDSYSWSINSMPVNNITYTNSGLYIDTSTNASGCLHTDSLNLTINYSNTGTSTVTACDTYSWDGVAYTTSGAYTNTYTNAAGCDSVHTLNLTINYSTTDTSYITACDSYYWPLNASVISTSGTYTDYVSNAAGCSHAAIIHLTINNSNTGTSSVTACDSYSWDGVAYTTSGAYINTYTNVAGCDSVHTLNLTINYSNTGASTVTACDTYSWDGVAYTTSGAYTNTYTNAAGCDSVHTLNLTINYSTTDTSYITACDSYSWDGVAYTTSGAYTNTYTNLAGCDSMHTLNLTINYSNTGASTVTACDTYSWDGVAYTTSGAYTNTYTNVAGCDSTVTLDLTINNSTSSTDTHVACDSFMWNCDGNLYTSSNNTATYTYTNAAGCDSTVTLDLTINNSTSSTDTHVACDEFMWNCDGNLYTSSNNTATYTYTNAAGCDSTVTLDLTINNSTSSTDTHVACDEFMWNCDGNLYTSSNNTATYTYTNAAGCDSVVTLDLTINSSSSSTDTHVACDTYTWIDGITYSASNNSATHTIPNASGCDSIITLNLTLNNSSIGTTNATACDTYTWAVNGTAYTTSGTYTYVSTNTNGCDHTETLTLIINNSTSNTTNATACDTYTWAVNGTAYTTSGTYTYVSTNSAGCDHTETLDLTINNSTSSTDTHVACDSFMWNCDGNLYTASNNTATYVYTNTAGCDSTVTLDLTINSILSSINQSGETLSAVTTPVGLTANWYNIQTENNDSRIWLMEEDASTFTPTFDCSYFIIVSDNGCTDTSEIYSYGENAARIGSFITSPNPTTGLLNVKFDNPKNQFVMLELISNNGSKLDEFITIENNLDIDLSNYPSGTYYLYFNSEDAVQGCRLEEVQKISTKIILNK